MLIVYLLEGSNPRFSAFVLLSTRYLVHNILTFESHDLASHREHAAHLRRMSVRGPPVA